MPAVNRIAAAYARATGTVIVTRGREQVISELRKFLRRIGGDERRVVRVHLIPELPALNHMRRRAFAPVAAAVRHEKLAVLVVVETPRIAAAVREDFKLMTNRMITPHTGAQLRTFFRGHARFPDARRIEHALNSVEPAVRPPEKTVQRLVRVLITEAIEQYLRRAIRFVVAIAIGDEQQL